MHLVLLSAGKGDALSTQHLHHGHPPSARADASGIDLLILDARHMTPACLSSATRCVVEIRARHGLRHGVLLCTQPTLPLIVASIRCGLRDVITQYLGAAHLRHLLRASLPNLTRREFRDAVAFLRTFSAFSTTDSNSLPLARRAEELTRRAETLAEQEKAIALEKDRLARLEQDLRDRTRRLDRQIARLQNDADVQPGFTNAPFASPGRTNAPFAGGSNSPIPDYAAMSSRLEQRAAELDVREKLLNEMQTLLMATPQGSAVSKQLPLPGAATASPAPGAAPAKAPALIGAAA
jgi:hypothetical protein